MEHSFGFVAICLSEKDCSPAGNVTVKSLETLDAEARILRIRRTAIRNLENTLRIMHFLHAHDLDLYRMSAGLIPLATHDVTQDWPWWDDESIGGLLKRIGEAIRRHDYRVSSHLPEVCVLSTPKPDVLKWLRRYLQYHRILFETMGLDERAKIVVHIGGAYNHPERALKQAEENFARLDRWAGCRIALENDDKVFSVRQTLDLAGRLGVPMVFDYHHHVLRNDGEPLDELVKEAAATWTDRPFKVHVSSPKASDKRRAHADYVDWEFVRPFFETLHELGIRSDVMVEAKKKDLALFALQEAYQRHFALANPRQ